MCLERTTEDWVGVDGTDGGGETVPYVGDGHSEGTPSELRPASFDGSGRVVEERSWRTFESTKANTISSETC